MIPHATVLVTNTDTGIAHGYVSNGANLYVAPLLQPGHYEVKAIADNFGGVKASNLTLLVGQTPTINLTLTVKSTATTVEVSSETPVLNVEQT